MSVLVLSATSLGNHAFAKTYVLSNQQNHILSKEEKKKFNEKTKALAEESRKKALEKIYKITITKKDDAKKQLALDSAKTMEVITKKLVPTKSKK